MRFFNKEQEIDFNAFKKALPAEAAVLEPHLDRGEQFEYDSDHRLFLKSKSSGPISFELESKLKYHQRFFYKNSVYSQPLAKALGIKKGRPRPKVLDATAGTLKDSMLILAMGCDVLACERNPIVQALILNALKFVEFEARFEFIPKGTLDLISERGDFDVAYYDPMYEQKNEKAAPRKEMRIFREVVQVDSDIVQVGSALRATGKRLVIKRSSKAAPLIGAPEVSFGKKSTIYDVYI